MLKRIVLKSIRFSGLPNLFRFIYQRKRVTVIYYHDIDKKSFESQVEYLVKQYNVIDLSLFKNYLLDKSIVLPHYSILITFDDGHKRNFELLSVAKKYSIKPVIFLTTSNIGSRMSYWFKLPFKSKDEKEGLKKMPDEQRRLYLEEHYKEYFQSELEQALSWEQIVEMKDCFDFQSHTHEHPCLPNCSVEVIRYELSQSKRIIEQSLNQEVFAIAYPNGDYASNVLKTSKEEGYQLGFTGNAGFISKKSNNLALNRLSTNDTNDLNEFILRVTGLWSFLKNFLKK